MKELIVLIAAAISAAVSTDVHASVAELVGTYEARDKGGVREVLKIEREGDSFVLFDKTRDGAWRKAKQPLVPVTKEQFAKMLKGAPADLPFDGLSNKGMAVFKVPKGWGQGKFKTETGYFMVFALGPIELVKR